ncbi:MAG: endonuclease V [Candidatus Limnocylindrales bacterium]
MLAPDRPRQADDVLAQGVGGRCRRRAGNAADQGSRSSVVTACVPSAYVPGLLARREGPILAAALAALDLRPEVLVIDASGLELGLESVDVYGGVVAVNFADATWRAALTTDFVKFLPVATRQQLADPSWLTRSRWNSAERAPTPGNLMGTGSF